MGPFIITLQVMYVVVLLYFFKLKNATKNLLILKILLNND